MIPGTSCALKTFAFTTTRVVQDKLSYHLFNEFDMAPRCSSDEYISLRSFYSSVDASKDLDKAVKHTEAVHGTKLSETDKTKVIDLLEKDQKVRDEALEKIGAYEMMDRATANVLLTEINDMRKQIQENPSKVDPVVTQGFWGHTKKLVGKIGDALQWTVKQTLQLFSTLASYIAPLPHMIWTNMWLLSLIRDLFCEILSKKLRYEGYLLPVVVDANLGNVLNQSLLPYQGLLYEALYNSRHEYVNIIKVLFGEKVWDQFTSEVAKNGIIGTVTSLGGFAVAYKDKSIAFMKSAYGAVTAQWWSTALAAVGIPFMMVLAWRCADYFMPLIDAKNWDKYVERLLILRPWSCIQPEVIYRFPGWSSFIQNTNWGSVFLNGCALNAFVHDQMKRKVVQDMVAALPVGQIASIVPKLLETVTGTSSEKKGRKVVARSTMVTRSHSTKKKVTVASGTSSVAQHADSVIWGLGPQVMAYVGTASGAVYLTAAGAAVAVLFVGVGWYISGGPVEYRQLVEPAVKKYLAENACAGDFKADLAKTLLGAMWQIAKSPFTDSTLQGLKHKDYLYAKYFKLCDQPPSKPLVWHYFFESNEVIQVLSDQDNSDSVPGMWKLRPAVYQYGKEGKHYLKYQDDKTQDAVHISRILPRHRWSRNDRVEVLVNTDPVEYGRGVIIDVSDDNIQVLVDIKVSEGTPVIETVKKVKMTKQPFEIRRPLRYEKQEEVFVYYGDTWKPGTVDSFNDRNKLYRVLMKNGSFVWANVKHLYPLREGQDLDVWEGTLKYHMKPVEIEYWHEVFPFVIGNYDELVELGDGEPLIERVGDANFAEALLITRRETVLPMFLNWVACPDAITRWPDDMLNPEWVDTSISDPRLKRRLIQKPFRTIKVGTRNFHIYLYTPSKRGLKVCKRSSCRPFFGVDASEMRRVHPAAVSTNIEGYLYVYYHLLPPTVHKAIKTLNAYRPSPKAGPLAPNGWKPLAPMGTAPSGAPLSLYWNGKRDFRCALAVVSEIQRRDVGYIGMVNRDLFATKMC